MVISIMGNLPKDYRLSLFYPSILPNVNLHYLTLYQPTLSGLAIKHRTHRPSGSLFKHSAPPGESALHPALKNAPRQKHAPVALLTPDPNISAHPYHLPLVAATGVLLLKAHNIANLYLHL